MLMGPGRGCTPVMHQSAPTCPAANGCFIHKITAGQTGLRKIIFQTVSKQYNFVALILIMKITATPNAYLVIAVDNLIYSGLPIIQDLTFPTALLVAISSLKN